MIAAERLKSKIQTQFFKSSDNNPAENLQFSIGVAVYPSDADSIEALINQAEKRLFESEKESHTLAYKN